MPSVNVAKFRAEVDKVNKTLGRFVKSSLEPILVELGTQPTVMLDPTKANKVQEAILHIPADKQLKYKPALDILKIAGFSLGARPCDAKMKFVQFRQGPYSYAGRDQQGKAKMVIIDNPGVLSHYFDLYWKSSNGSMSSLQNVATQEWIKFRTSQQAPPFNDVMPTLMEFAWGFSATAHIGENTDDHSTKPPKLICRYPIQAGENVAEQQYQYRLVGSDVWHSIPDAAFLITKGFRQSGGKWVFFFRKKNWLERNKVPFHFEVEYPVGAPLVYPPMPGQKFNVTTGNPDDIHEFGKVISMG